MSQCPTSPIKVRAAQRRQEALLLRIQGYTYPEIASKLGVTRRRAAQYVSESLKRMYDRIPDLTAHYRQLTLTRLEHMFRALWPAIQKGDSRAAATAVKILTNQARLLGLNEPTRLAARVTAGSLENWTEEELVAEARRLGIRSPLSLPSPDGHVNVTIR
jgi:hypothetical protein